MVTCVALPSRLPPPLRLPVARRGVPVLGGGAGAGGRGLLVSGVAPRPGPLALDLQSGLGAGAGKLGGAQGSIETTLPATLSFYLQPQ